jgi:predicted dehydrogenase
MSKVVVGFLGAGGIARSHALALSTLKFYYSEVPEIQLEAVTSLREETRNYFAKKYEFRKSLDYDSFIRNREIDTIFILGPNKVHYTHLAAIVNMSSIKRIYLEKPVCSSKEEEESMVLLAHKLAPKIKIQVGFQLLQMSAIREAFLLWNTGMFGKPIHFNFTLKHSDYLQKSYREKRGTRLTPAPDGGAMADLGSHAISLAVAFLGKDLQIIHAMQSGYFEDVVIDSDLYSEISVIEPASKAIGTISGSRISSGTGDLLALEIYAEKGSIRFSSQEPDSFEYYLEEHHHWTKIYTGSNYEPTTSFPSKHVPGGWLRSLFHAHYLFLTDRSHGGFIPDINHGLAVQRLVRETADYLKIFRETKH